MALEKTLKVRRGLLTIWRLRYVGPGGYASRCRFAVTTHDDTDCSHPLRVFRTLEDLHRALAASEVCYWDNLSQAWLPTLSPE